MLPGSQWHLHVWVDNYTWLPFSLVIFIMLPAMMLLEVTFDWRGRFLKTIWAIYSCHSLVQVQGCGTSAGKLLPTLVQSWIKFPSLDRLRWRWWPCYLCRLTWNKIPQRFSLRYIPDHSKQKSKVEGTLKWTAWSHKKLVPWPRQMFVMLIRFCRWSSSSG